MVYCNQLTERVLRSYASGSQYTKRGKAIPHNHVVHPGFLVQLALFPSIQLLARLSEIKMIIMKCNDVTFRK